MTADGGEGYTYSLEFRGTSMLIRADNDEDAKREAQKIVDARKTSCTLYRSRVVATYVIEQPKYEMPALKDISLYEEKE